MKSYQTVSSSNQDLQGQNMYLCKQLKKSMKQKHQILESPTSSNLEELSEAKN